MVAHCIRELQEQKHFVESITTASPDILFVMDLLTERIIYSNHPVERVLGYSNSEIAVMNEPFFDIMYPPDLEAMYTHLEKMRKDRDGEVLEIEYRLKDVNGKVHWYRDRNTIFRRDANGNAIEKIGISTDITLRKEVEEELKDEHYFLEQITDKTPLLIYVCDLVQNSFTYINKRVEELVGKDQDYIIAMGPHLFQVILHPDDLQRRNDYMKELATLRNDEVRQMEFRIWNGREFRWIRSRESIFFRESSTVQQVIGIGEDVTYEKLLIEKIGEEGGHIGLN